MLKHLICALLGLALGMAPVSDMQRVFFESEAIAFQEDAELMTLRVCPILGADCMLLTLGARFSDRVTGNVKTFASEADIIHDRAARRNRSAFRVPVFRAPILKDLHPVLHHPPLFLWLSDSELLSLPS